MHAIGIDIGGTKIAGALVSEDGSIVVGKVLEARGQAFGYDAQGHEYGDLIEKGIIDPAKVVRVALQDAASVAGLAIVRSITQAHDGTLSLAAREDGGLCVTVRLPLAA